MSEEPKFPLVPRVDFPADYEIDRQLSERSRAAIMANDPQAEAEVRLDIAHRAMVYRDALLSQVVEGVQRGDGDMVLHRAPHYAFWHCHLEKSVEEAARIVQQTPELEAER